MLSGRTYADTSPSGSHCTMEYLKCGDLEIHRRALVLRKEDLWKLPKADLVNVMKFKNQRMNLGKGKRKLVPGLEDVMMVNLTKLSAPQLWVINGITGGVTEQTISKQCLLSVHQ